MTTYYQRPLTKEQLIKFDNSDEMQNAMRFYHKAPSFNSELYEKIAIRNRSRQFKHKESLRKLGNLTINNALKVRAPLFN